MYLLLNPIIIQIKSERIMKKKNIASDAKVPPALWICKSIESMQSGLTDTSSKPSEHW